MNRNRDAGNQKLLFALVTAMMLIVMGMVSAVFLATRRPVVVVVPQSIEGGAATQAISVEASDEAVADQMPVPVVSVLSLANVPKLDDPFDAQWEQIASVEVPLQAQQVAEPMLAAATVHKIHVQAVREKTRYVWRLRWEQSNPSFASDVSTFSDAVALQFPLADGAPYTMGGPEMPVAIWYWRAIWQKDVDEGFQDSTIVRPNAYNDFYWFASHTGPQSADKLIEGDAMAQQWMIAASAGNPMADFKRKCPMEELRAHGFGTSTHSVNMTGNARGKWHEGSWYVVIEREITDDDPLKARFDANPQQQLIAFAVWDGANQNRGGQKSISNWIPMRIEP